MIQKDIKKRFLQSEREVMLVWSSEQQNEQQIEKQKKPMK